MVWNEQWSIKVDGNQINDKTNFWTTIPEIDDLITFDVVTVAIPNDYPVYIRTQPLSASLTFNISMTPCTWAVYRSRLEWLQTVFAPGPHTLLIQVRGMSDPKSLVFIAKQLTVADAKARAVSVQAVVPKPILV